MANGGWYGTQAEWDAAERPLSSLDPIFEEFAKANGFALSKNLKDWPERSLRANMPLASLLQVFRGSLDANAWKVWAVCSDDRGDRRYWQQAFIADGVTDNQLSAGLKTYLVEGLGRLTAWNAQPQDLVFATRIGLP